MTDLQDKSTDLQNAMRRADEAVKQALVNPDHIHSTMQKLESSAQHAVEMIDKQTTLIEELYAEFMIRASMLKDQQLVVVRMARAGAAGLNDTPPEQIKSQAKASKV